MSGFHYGRKRIKPEIATICTVCAVAVLLTGCVLAVNGVMGQSPAGVQSHDTVSRNSTSVSDSASSDGGNISSQSASSASEPGFRPGDYEFGTPLPEGSPVGGDYFDDAVFLGDSRTDMFAKHVSLSRADVFAKTGMNVRDVFITPCVEDNGTQIPIMDAVRRKRYNKAYIMFGVNECGWDCKPCFGQQYEKLVDALREMNPDMVIYVQSIIPVTKSKSECDPYENNDNIALYNKMILEMCQKKQVYFVNVAESMVNEEGILPEEASLDGVHLKKSYCEKWLEYLQTHTAESVNAPKGNLE